jgi:hypothetical protein
MEKFLRTRNYFICVVIFWILCLDFINFYIVFYKKAGYCDELIHRHN